LEAAAGVDLAVDEELADEPDDEELESDEDLAVLDDESDEPDDSLLELDDSLLELEPLLALLTDSRLSVR
jgi:hypothetical protein